MKWIVFALAAVLLAGVASAADLRIDGSSKETFDRSAKAMADTLSESDKEIFARGLMNIIITDYPPAKGAEGLAVFAFASAAVDAAHITAAGKTLPEIMARGRKLAAETGGGETANQNPEINVREQRRACLRKAVTVQNAAIKKKDFGTDISFEVDNRLPWAISGVRIGYRATSPGRPVPWMEKDFALAVPGGIQPGEVRRLATSAFPPGGAPPDLTIEAEILDVADEHKRLFVKDVTVIDWGKEQSDKACP